MKITIQQIDYSAALDAAQPLTVERKLNQPSRCIMTLSLPRESAQPQRGQAIAIAGDDGTVYFTGFITAAVPEFSGLALDGPRARLAIEALSDESLLDQAGPIATSTAGQTTGQLMASLVTRTGLAALSTQGVTLGTPVGSFSPQPAAPWSKTAGQLAAATRAAYRALQGALTLNAIPSAVHNLSEADGSLDPSQIQLTSNAGRLPANDITVYGEHEPATYVTEIFMGDGVTTKFDLSEPAWFPPSSRSTLLHDLFNQSRIEPRTWSYAGPLGCITTAANGLVLQGGNGTDGQTTLTALDRVEMGGTLLLEATGITLAAGSNGILPGFFAGQQNQAACTAGFRATAAPVSGAVTLQPIVMGTLVGPSFSVDPANQYALRIRMHCAETERTLATWRAAGDNGPIVNGGQSNTPPTAVQLEIQESVNGVAAMPIVLFEGPVHGLPDACSVVAASSFNLVGTMRSLSLMQLGPCWVTSTVPNGGPRIRRSGPVAQAAECVVDRTGRLTFYNGFTPIVGEQIAVRYRTVQRAVGRAVDSANQQALQSAGLAPVRAWGGSVTSPAPRSSQDCRNAAQTLVTAAAGTQASWSGTWRSTNLTLDADIWPGDALQLQSPALGLNGEVVVRAVQLRYRASMPDLVEYAVAFANDWAGDLAIHTSTTIPLDADLPAIPNATPLDNLSALAITSINGAAVTLSTGVAPPPGGGFEIRRRDNTFMSGTDADLVLRTTQSTFSLTRASASDRTFVRMYDAATPPNYSEFSAELIFNGPTA